MAGSGAEARGVVVARLRRGRARAWLAVALLLAVVGCLGGDNQTSTSGAATSSTVATDAATSTSASGTGTTSAASGTSTSGTGTTSAASGTTSTSGADVCEPVDSFGVETYGGLVECDIWEQDCPPCEKCTPWKNNGEWWTDKCVPIPTDPKQFGEPCTVAGSPGSGFDDCDKGLMCWYFDEDDVGYCIEHCIGSPDAPSCTDPNALCHVDSSAVLTFCVPSCDPLLQDCPGDRACLPLGRSMQWICVLDASGPDAGADGDPCEYENACDPGLLCMDGARVPGCQTAGCCASFCDLEEPNTCPLKDQGAECVPYYAMGEAPPGKENLGFCGLP